MLVKSLLESLVKWWRTYIIIHVRTFKTNEKKLFNIDFFKYNNNSLQFGNCNENSLELKNNLIQSLVNNIEVLFKSQLLLKFGSSTGTRDVEEVPK